MKYITILFLAVSLKAAQVEAFVGFAPNSPMVFGHAPVKGLSLVGVDVSLGKKTFEYVISTQYLTVPGSHSHNFGITPLGVRFNFFGDDRLIHPFLLADAGIIASTRPIPVPRPNATGLNFLVDFGAGVKIGRASVGYKLLHVSNAGTTNFNPGLDANVFFVSYRIV